MSITNKKLGSKWAQSWHANSPNFDEFVGSMESLYFATLAGEWDTLGVHIIDRLQLSEQHGMSTNPWKPWGQRPDNSVSWPSFPYFQKSRWSSILHPHVGDSLTMSWLFKKSWLVLSSSRRAVPTQTDLTTEPSHGPSTGGTTWDNFCDLKKNVLRFPEGSQQPRCWVFDFSWESPKEVRAMARQCKTCWPFFGSTSG